MESGEHEGLGCDPGHESGSELKAPVSSSDLKPCWAVGPGGGRTLGGLWWLRDLSVLLYHPQNQLAACTRALESSEELLETANQTLQAADSEDFPQVGVSEWTPRVPGSDVPCLVLFIVITCIYLC